jgi:hypothetical protein
MPTIGLICEGPTDHVVLARLLDGLVGDVTVNPIQPPVPMRPGVDFGGWEQVFASIRRRDVSGAQAFLDLVVVHIDTDVCEHPNYGVARRDGDRVLTTAEVRERVVDRLRAEIAEHDPAADLARVAFAVCVDTIECWLLLLLHAARAKTTGCEAAVNQALKRANFAALNKRDPRTYEAPSKPLRAKKDLDRIRGRAPDLDAFVAAIGAWRDAR